MYCICSTTNMTTVCLKTMPDLRIVNHNYTMHRSIITVLIREHDYNTNTLCMQLQCQLVHCALEDESFEHATSTSY